MRDLPQTVVETAGYLRNAAAFFNEEERAGIAAHIGRNPEAGSIVPETGRSRDLLLSQRNDPSVLTRRVREERKSESLENRAQRAEEDRG